MISFQISSNSIFFIYLYAEIYAIKKYLTFSMHQIYVSRRVFFKLCCLFYSITLHVKNSVHYTAATQHLYHVSREITAFHHTHSSQTFLSIQLQPFAEKCYYRESYLPSSNFHIFCFFFHYTKSQLDFLLFTSPRNLDIECTICATICYHTKHHHRHHQEKKHHIFFISFF